MPHLAAPPLSSDEPGAFGERRRTPEDVRAQREEELHERGRAIAARIRPAFRQLGEEELQALARDMARSEYRFHDVRPSLDF